MLVELERVTRAFDSIRALDSVSLQVADGLTTAVIGESGCGKSTLLQHVNGLLRPDSGVVRVFGEPVPTGARLEALRRGIGYAVQGIGLFPHLTAFANVTLLARLTGWTLPAMQQRFAELCELLELDPRLGERYPHALSGGQQQRMGICRALMMRPRLVLLDEPFSAVDPITRQTIHAEFERARAHENTGVLLVTHDMAEARRLAHQLVVMRHGRIVQHGPVEDVVAGPADDYVRTLVETQAFA